MKHIAAFTIRSFQRQLPRLMFLAAAFTVRDIQAHFAIPTWAIVIAALPGIIALTAVADTMTGWLKHILIDMEAGHDA